MSTGVNIYKQILLIVNKIPYYKSLQIDESGYEEILFNKKLFGKRLKKTEINLPKQYT